MRQLIDQPFGSIADLIRAHAAHAPGRAALVDPDLPSRSLTYGALDATMDRIAATLQAAGLARGDCIALCAQPGVAYAAVFLGALRAGVAVAPLAPSATPQSLARMLEDAEARLLFVDASVQDLLAALPPGPASRIALDDSDAGEPLAGWLEPDARPRPVAIAPETPFNIIYSSGTTGEPKGIVQPHRMRWAHIQRGRPYGYTPHSVTVLATPLYTNTTLVVFFPTLAFGGTVVIVPRFSVTGYLAVCERHRATHTMLVPVQYQRLMASEAFDRADLSSFVTKFCTSAPFPAALKADVLRRWPGGLVEFYGMTEGGASCILDAHLHPDKLHTVGRAAPGSDVRLIDEAGREVPAGMAGEVVGHSRGMMSGYHRQPEKTREVEWFDAAGKRYIRTGDIGRFDSDGFLVLSDRRKDMIISGGFNIFPSDLEQVLAGHPAVEEAAVVGIPSQEWGESPAAFVVLRGGVPAPDAQALRAWANARVGKTQRLALLAFVQELPRSPIGKVLKRELRQQAASLHPPEKAH